MWKRLFLAVFILLAMEVGLFLLLIPWSQAWTRNYFVVHLPFLRTLFLNQYFSGAVSGLGLLNLWAGLSEAWKFRETVKAMDAREAAEAARLKDLEQRVQAD